MRFLGSWYVTIGAVLSFELSEEGRTRLHSYSPALTTGSM